MIELVLHLGELLGDRLFVLGEQPRVIDWRSERHANLVAYRRRIRERWWSDLPPLSA